MKLLLTTIESECKYTGLAMKYLYSVVAGSPLDVKLRTFSKDIGYMDVFEAIAGGQYNIVYFHCYENNETVILRVAEMVKKAAPSTAVVFGGMHVSFGTKEFMEEHPFVDYVIRGEGETVLFSFLKALLDHEYDFGGIAGFAYREGENVTVNPFDAPVELEDLPFPYENFDPGNGTVYYESIRGTSDRTVISQHLPDARIRALGLSRVCTELRYFLAKEVNKVVFFDRYFNYNSERAYRIFEYIINNDNGITSFEFNINADELDDETLRLLSEARKGQLIFHIDVESTNDDVLTSIGRSANIYRLMYNSTKLLRNGNIRSDIHIRAGLPLETEQLFARSFNKAYGMAEGMPVHIDPLYMTRGTLLREDSGRFGYIYASESPYEVISTGYLKADELLRIRAVSRTVESYIGDGGFKNSIPRILNDTGMKPYELFSALTSFIARSGLRKRMHKKEHLGRILYAFACGLYDEFAVTSRLGTLQLIISEDLEDMLDQEAMKKFERKGWEIEAKKRETEVEAAATEGVKADVWIDDASEEAETEVSETEELPEPVSDEAEAQEVKGETAEASE